ncbi:MAG: hypothetical protein HY927_06885 [Elusimicrobia bacterium]|nr:hypothetical protein [Elusimicrobiota bacterium]
MPKLLATAGALALAVLSARLAPCRADEGAWDPVTPGPAITWRAPVTPHRTFIFRPLLWYNHVRGRYDASGDFSALPGDDGKSFLQQVLFFQYGLTGRAELAAQTAAQEFFVRTSGARASVAGMADSFLYARYRLRSESERLPEVAAVFQLRLPTGKYQEAYGDNLGADIMGTGSWDHGYGLNMCKRLRPFFLHADTSITFPFGATVDGAVTDYAPYLNYDLAAELVLGRGFNLLAELNGFSQGDVRKSGERIPDTKARFLNMIVGAGWSSDSLQAILGCQRTLRGVNADALDSVVASVVLSFDTRRKR